jgi:capsular exopolysaccharide synthesis family protein
MSRIFDALQRAEGERSGKDLSTLTAATELLQLVERQSVSEWETTGQPEQSDAKENTKREARFSGQPTPAVKTTVEGSGATNLLLTDQQLDQLAQFKSLHISFSSQSQLVSLQDNDSLAAENFRFLGMRLRHLRRERPLKKVLISSTIPHEGKSMVAANLACTLARKKQQRTVLLEGDLRRPALSQIFGLSPLPGICEWLHSEQREIANIYHLEGPHLENSGLWIFPAGSTLGNPLELLQSARLPALMDQLAMLFDWVIIDSPPVLPLADTSVWSRVSDGIVLVTRQGTTEKQHLKRGIEALDQKKLIGALLNSSQSSALNDHYYYRPGAASRQSKK